MIERIGDFWRNLRQWYLLLPRGYRFLLRALAAILALAIVLGVVYVITRPDPAPDASCTHQNGSVVQHSGPSGECVGVSDGNYDFDSSLSDVESRIAAENHQVVQTHPNDYVSVVLLLPIAPGQPGILSQANAVEQLRGAYTAQYYANRNAVEGSSPAIRLLVASDGAEGNQWHTTVGIIEAQRSSQHIVAVTGIGISLDSTKAAVQQLAGDGIPVVGGTLTSDDFDNIRNFVRVAPSNADGISVAVQYAQQTFNRALLVEDENTADIYDATLVTGFAKFGDSAHAIIGRETYDTTRRTHPLPGDDPVAVQAVISNRIQQMSTNICVAQPAAVLFAGRGRDLADLVTSLGQRPCLDRPITILSGDDVTNIPTSDGFVRGLNSGVTVDYVGIAHPDEWSTGSDPAVLQGRQGFTTFNTTFQSLFPGAPLTDGNTMSAYDSVLVAVSATRLTSLPQPDTSAVAQELGALQGAHTVLGASGPLAFTADSVTSSTGSNPVGKAVPVLQLRPDGTAAFVTLKWPTGQPPAY